MHEYRPDLFRFMAPQYLIEQLDFLVREPSDPDYLVLRERLLFYANKATDHNPFRAGRPSRFCDSEKIEMMKMKESGKSFREIAAYFECSTSVVHRCICEAKTCE